MAVGVVAIAGLLASIMTSPLPAADPTPAVNTATTAGELSLSMVDLLSGEDGTDPLTLTELEKEVFWYTEDSRASLGHGVDIALIDSGVAPVDGLDGDNVLHGPDLSGEGSQPQVAYLDTYGHGTHLAGIMVGQRDGHPGLAPQARVVSVKVAGRDGVTTVPQVVAAIDWVVEHRNTDGLNIRVLNLSLGQAGVSDHEGDLLSAAVERAWDAGIFVVVAAGNRGSSQTHLDSPAIDPFVLAVGSVDPSTDYFPDLQSPTTWTAQGDGTRNPDVVVAGRSIASYRVPGSTVDELAPQARYGDGLFLGSGTSQSAAAVSGVVARIISANPSLTADDVKRTVLWASYTWLDNPDEQLMGEGYLDGSLAMDQQYRAYQSQNHDQAAGPGTGIVAPSGATWSGGGWSGATWSGATWSGATWSGATWSGATWSGATWSGATWSGATWSGATWSGATWSGATWSGATWSGATWSGATWSGNGWN